MILNETPDWNLNKTEIIQEVPAPYIINAHFYDLSITLNNERFQLFYLNKNDLENL